MSVERGVSSKCKFHVNYFNAFFGNQKIAAVEIVKRIFNFVEDANDFQQLACNKDRILFSDYVAIAVHGIFSNEHVFRLRLKTGICKFRIKNNYIVESVSQSSLCHSVGNDANTSISKRVHSFGKV